MSFVTDYPMVRDVPFYSQYQHRSSTPRSPSRQQSSTQYRSSTPRSPSRQQPSTQHQSSAQHRSSAQHLKTKNPGKALFEYNSIYLLCIGNYWTPQVKRKSNQGQKRCSSPDPEKESTILMQDYLIEIDRKLDLLQKKDEIFEKKIENFYKRVRNLLREGNKVMFFLFTERSFNSSECSFFKLVYHRSFPCTL